MADPHVITALVSRRAEIDGELRRTEKRVATLRADLETIDGAIRLFDPARVPGTIKPRVRRLRPRLFRHGQCSRAILSVLRTARGPLTVPEIVARLVADYHLDLADARDRAGLVANVRATLTRYTGKVVTREKRGADEVVWSVT